MKPMLKYIGIASLAAGLGFLANNFQFGLGAFLTISGAVFTMNACFKEHDLK